MNLDDNTRFTAMDPANMLLLLGTGLIGLAGVARKKRKTIKMV